MYLCAFYSRLIIDDGSGEGYVYCYNDLVTVAIKVPSVEWCRMLEVLKGCGKAYYNRQQNSSLVSKWFGRWPLLFTGHTLNACAL